MMPTMISRAHELERGRLMLKRHRIVGLLGARQVGKTTLARQTMAGWPGETAFYDLEDPDDQARLSDPMLALRGRKGLIVIDEIQRRPDLFPVLRVLADHAGAELDLLVVRGRRRLGFEIKRASAPVLTPSMRIAMEDLRLTSLTVVHAGRHSYDLAPKTRAIGAGQITELPDKL
jgi:AAA domain